MSEHQPQPLTEAGRELLSIAEGDFPADLLRQAIRDIETEAASRVTRVLMEGDASRAARTADPGGLREAISALLDRYEYDRALTRDDVLADLRQLEHVALASETTAPDAEWPDRTWLISHWVNHRCGYVDCRTTEHHEHGGGEPMTAAPDPEP